MANQPESKPDSQGYRRRPLLVGLQICSSRCLGARSGKRRDDSKQLKWLYVLSSSTVALDVDVAAAEWKKQENMCINLKNLNLLGSCSLVRRLVPVSVPVPVPVLLWVHTSQTTPTATPATSCDLWAQLLYIFLSCCCRGRCRCRCWCCCCCWCYSRSCSVSGLRRCSITGAVVFCGCHFVIYSAPWPAHWPGLSVVGMAVVGNEAGVLSWSRWNRCGVSDWGC